MGFLTEARTRLGRTVNQHGDSIAGGIDKAADAVDRRTGGRHRTRIAAVRGRAKDALSRLDDPGSTGRGTGTTDDGGPR